MPVWYDDAKLGIFIHWGLYSVPGWAPRVPDIQQLLIKDGPKRMLRENPYAEWYRNSMQIKGSPTATSSSPPNTMTASPCGPPPSPIR
jgi:alpha-L-fucosidase